MKKYITKEDLPDILQEIAEQTLAHADQIYTHFRIIQNTDNEDEVFLGVSVIDLKGNPLSTRTYVIANKIMDAYDVVKDTIEEGLHKLNEDYQ
jgi:hypothetical protein